MIYYSIIGILWVFALCELIRRRKARAVFVLPAFALIWFLIGLRWNCGTDWDPFITQYLTQTNPGFEPGYILLSSIASALSLSYTSFLLLISFIPLTAVFIFLWNKPGYFFAALIFFTANYMLGFMGGNRQSIALGIIILSNIFIEKRSPGLFFAAIVIASLFHSSAAVYLPAYFMLEKRIPIIPKYAFLFVTVVLGKEAAPLLLTSLHAVLYSAHFYDSAAKVSVYIDQAVFYGFTWGSVIKKVFLLVLFDIFFSRMQKEDRHTNLYINLYFFAVVIDTVFGPVNVAFMRAGTYYRAAEIILAACLIHSIKRKELALLALVLLLAYSLRQLYAGLSFYPDLFEPYRSIFY